MEIKIGFSYLDKSNTLHVVANRLDAEQYFGENSHIVQVNIAYDRGYPLIIHNGKEVCARVISPDQMKVGEEILPTTPEMRALYVNCLK